MEGPDVQEKRLDTKKYNTTDLNPETTFERHVFHRDQFAHYLRWTHILRESNIWEKVVDFWCWKWNLLEVLYRNMKKQVFYVWLDIRKATIEWAREYFKMVDWAKFICEDLVNPQNWTVFSEFKADRVCSFEVIEHVWKQNARAFLSNFLACWSEKALYYISTPNFDQKVWAAWNHTYDSWDGRWVAPQEFTYQELKDLFSEQFDIVKSFWTFASVKDYKPFMNDWQVKMFDALREYYDANLVSNIMAPLFPEQSRNTLWVLKRKEVTTQEK